MLLDRIAHLLHWLGFAAFLGGAFAQQTFMNASTRGTLHPAVRDAYERISANLVTRVELPALVLQVVSGAWFLFQVPGFMRMGWMHGKLTAVLILLVLSHVEMFNARAVARLRKRKGDAAAAEIAQRKRRHAQLGSVGTLAVVAVLGLVAFGR